MCDVSPLIGLVYCPVLLVRFKSTVLFSLHLCPPKLGLFAVLRHVRGAGGAPVGQISHIGPEFRGAEAAVVGVQNTVPVGFCRLHAPVRRQRFFPPPLPDCTARPECSGTCRLRPTPPRLWPGVRRCQRPLCSDRTPPDHRRYRTAAASWPAPDQSAGEIRPAPHKFPFSLVVLLSRSWWAKSSRHFFFRLPASRSPLSSAFP